MTLRAVHGNRTERLLAALLDELPPADPFAPTTIVVGSHLVARWLAREIALARGIFCGLELVTFDRFVERTWAGDTAARDAELRALDRRQLATSLASALADRAIVEPLAPLADYLAAAPASGDRAAPRRVQLADHLAELFWSYARARPELAAALAAGRVPNELGDDATARWQARLFEAALVQLPGRRAPTPMLPRARRAAGLPPPKLAAPLFVFGVSYFMRAELEALSDLAAASDVRAFVLDPCRELWDDVSARARADASEPLPLALWGGALKATLGALVERTGGDLDGAFVDIAAPVNAREQLLADTLDRRAPSATHDDAGVVVLACPNVRRELEAVAVEIRARLDADTTLRANEIAVLVASDVDRYLAQAPSAFEAVGVPCHLVDAPIDDRGRIGEAVLALLALPTSPLARRDLLRVMTHPAVLAGFPHVDAQDWVRWTERLGIARGADARAHAGTYLEAHADRFHWEQGVHRLALGAFMVGERAARPARIGAVEVAPEEVRADEQASAASYALLVRSLCADAAWLASFVAPLAEWARVLGALVDSYLAGARASGADRDFERARSTLAGLARLDLDGRAIGFREAREHATRQLRSARADRGEPLASGVAIVPLAPMRALPFRAIFVVGLDERAFPASDQPSSLDVSAGAGISPAGSIPSPRDRDRHAFFEALLGARDALYLSYVAVEPKSGQAIGPSSVVLELADALAPYLGAASSRDALARIERREPLHRFEGDGARELPPQIARERWAARTRDAVRAHLRARDLPVPAEDGMFAALAHPQLAELRRELGLVEPPPAALAHPSQRSLALSSLRSFLESPVQAWAQVVLDLDDLPDDEILDRSDEPFHVARGDRTMLLRDVFATQLAAEYASPNFSRELIYDLVVRGRELRGQFPVGVFGEAQRAQDLAALDAWHVALESWRRVRAIDQLAPTRYGFGRATSAHAKLVPALELELSGSRTVRLHGQTELLVKQGARYVSVVPILRDLAKRSQHHVRGALDHVVLAAAGLARDGHAHLLVDAQGRAAFVEHAPWSTADARGYLAELVGELLDLAHGYLLPFDALAKALAGARVAMPNDPITGGLGFGPIERRDGLDLPADAEAIARRRLAPLVAHLRGADHGFEVKS